MILLIKAIERTDETEFRPNNQNTPAQSRNFLGKCYFELDWADYKIYSFRLSHSKDSLFFMFLQETCGLKTSDELLLQLKFPLVILRYFEGQWLIEFVWLCPIYLILIYFILIIQHSPWASWYWLPISKHLYCLNFGCPPFIYSFSTLFFKKLLSKLIRVKQTFNGIFQVFVVRVIWTS